MTKKQDVGLSVGGPVMREDEARAYAQVGPTKFSAMIKAGEFPPPIMVGSRRKWLVTELDAWLEERKAARHAEVPAVMAAPTAPAKSKKKLRLRKSVRA
jgi:predicted DNA-binding transcriptional regulator AlpA